MFTDIFLQNTAHSNMFVNFVAHESILTIHRLETTLYTLICPSFPHRF